MTRDPIAAAPEALALLSRIADALERIAPAGAAETDLSAADAFVWHAAGRRPPAPG